MSTVRRVTHVSGLDKKFSGGAGGIRTLDRALQPYNGLANRRLQPLGHSSVRADMPDASVPRKRQICFSRIARLFGSTEASKNSYCRELIRTANLEDDP
jgi:hypothetical protein